MTKPKLFISRELFPDVIEKLMQYFEVEVWDRFQAPPYEVLLEKARVVDALVTLLTDRIDCNLLSQAKNLRIVAQLAVGYDNIDVECATRLGIYVTNTPGVLTEATAELTWALILSVARRIVEADHYVRWGEWYRTKTGWHPLMMLGVELKGKTLGIIGLGRIGRRVAEIGKAFGMKIMYYDRSRDEEAEKILGAEYRSLDEVLSESDIVSIHVPLTKETYHMINEEKLKRMKRTALLINTARGAVIDTDALVKALKEGWIAGAGLDVFEEEPLPPNHPLTAFKNVVLLPHIGSATIETRHAMAELVAENLIAFYQGREPPTLVNKEVVRIRPPGFSRQ
ncbi:Glyoxylate reductase [Ignisphaera aggregans DSM 17230]|uniref:Glyoxylate reductase n=1 Tax=Ignisphaera aggregans (strain DSM 17230 / JCM 13409 / AQ1.S1) TaxID=583356 RepID=E0SR65_IGNAA|nr:Glyoxylate reductase [Ignisphaera aggregans DSM 17230]